MHFLLNFWSEKMLNLCLFGFGISFKIMKITFKNLENNYLNQSETTTKDFDRIKSYVWQHCHWTKIYYFIWHKCMTIYTLKVWAIIFYSFLTNADIAHLNLSLKFPNRCVFLNFNSTFTFALCKEAKRLPSYSVQGSPSTYFADLIMLCLKCHVWDSMCHGE